MFRAFEHEDAGAVAHDETVAIDVERARRLSNIGIPRKGAGANQTFVDERA